MSSPIRRPWSRSEWPLQATIAAGTLVVRYPPAKIRTGSPGKPAPAFGQTPDCSHCTVGVSLIGVIGEPGVARSPSAVSGTWRGFPSCRWLPPFPPRTPPRLLRPSVRPLQQCRVGGGTRQG